MSLFINLLRLFLYNFSPLILLVGVYTDSVFATPQTQIKMVTEHCSPEKSTDDFLYSSDFKWGYKIEDLRRRYVEIYNSNKRLKNRAYYDAEKKLIVLPGLVNNKLRVVVDTKFITNISGHIEEALKKEIIDGVFLPDMGHSHFFIPQKKYNAVYAPIPNDQMHILFEKLLADPDIKVLYHTAEQLGFLDANNQLIRDDYLLHRLQTRNLVGHNNGSREIFNIHNPESPVNTARELPEHYFWSSGFNISANKNGCFYYTHKNKKIFFDISLYDLAPDPNSVNLSETPE